jgi:hypothetical protein
MRESGQRVRTLETTDRSSAEWTRMQASARRGEAWSTKSERLPADERPRACELVLSLSSACLPLDSSRPPLPATILLPALRMDPMMATRRRRSTTRAGAPHTTRARRPAALVHSSATRPDVLLCACLHLSVVCERASEAGATGGDARSSPRRADF